MKEYKEPKVSAKVKKFREDTKSESLFSFGDPSLDEKPTYQIHNHSNLHIGFYSEEAIEVDSFNYPPSIIITPHQILNW